MSTSQRSPSDRPPRVLLVSDDPDDRHRLLQALQPDLPGLLVCHVRTEKSLALALARSDFDLAMIEAQLPWTDSMAAIQAIRARIPSIPAIAITDPACAGMLHAAAYSLVDSYAVRASGQLVCLPAAVGLALERAHERQTMQEARARYFSLFDGVPVGLYRTTPDGRIIDANLALVQMLGYPSREALLEVNAIDLYVNPDERARWQALIRQGEKVRSFEVQFYRRDGTAIWVENNTHAVRDQEHRLSYYEGILEDITERKRAHLALRESEESFRTIVEQSPLSVQVMTPDGWIIQVNRAWEKLWGVTSADVQYYNALHDPQARSLGMMPYVERGFAGETVTMPPVAYHTPESLRLGRKRWFQAHIYPVKGERGEIRNVIMLYEDITERQWATEDLQRLSSELMSAQEAERKRISQELHDELGQALTAIRINLAALEKELGPALTPANGERLAESGTLADQMLQHVRELSHDLRPTMLDELGLVPTLRWYVGRFAHRLGLEVQFEAAGLEERLAAELETALYRIVQEALTNVARHAGARRVCLRLERNALRVITTIEDDGVGFDVRRWAAAATPALGAGLFGMRERAALRGGSFTIHAHPGQGTRLVIELPLIPPQPEREER